MVEVLQPMLADRGYRLLLDRGSVLDIRNAKGNLVKPDYQVVTPNNLVALLTLQRFCKLINFINMNMLRAHIW